MLSKIFWISDGPEGMHPVTIPAELVSSTIMSVSGEATTTISSSTTSVSDETTTTTSLSTTTTSGDDSPPGGNGDTTTTSAVPEEPFTTTTDSGYSDDTSTTTTEAAALAADFYAVPKGGYAPLEVFFYNTSTSGDVSFYWDFGDGDNSTEENPVHTYRYAGIYTVALEITGKSGSTAKEEKEGYIYVSALSLCPFQRSINDMQYIETLQTLKDKRLDNFAGRILTIIFYKNAPEITKILEADPALKSRFVDLVTDNISVAEELIATGKAKLPKINEDEIINFLNDVKKEGSLKLKIYVNLVIRGIKYRFLLDGIGISID